MPRLPRLLRLLAFRPIGLAVQLVPTLLLSSALVTGRTARSLCFLRAPGAGTPALGHELLVLGAPKSVAEVLAPFVGSLLADRAVVAARHLDLTLLGVGEGSVNIDQQLYHYCERLAKE